MVFLTRVRLPGRLEYLQINRTAKHPCGQQPARHGALGAWRLGARTPGDRLGNVVFGQKTSDYYQRDIEFKFFEHYLKNNGAMTLPEATIFEKTGSNRWAIYEAWPPSIQPKNFTFAPDKK